MSKFINKVVTGVSTLALAASMFVAPVAMTAHAATAGEVYKTTDGTVWFIDSSMHRRAFTSWGAFQSYGFLSASQIKDADASVTALSTGDFIAPQDGRIFCATATKGSDVSGECSLITGSKKAAFTSAAVFSGQGYSFSRAFYGDSSFLDKTSNIENASAQHRPGTLINNNGTVQLVVTGGLWGTPSMDVFNSWGWSFADVVPANSADVLLSQTGVISARTAGQLSPSATTGEPTPSTGDCTEGEGTVNDFSVGSPEDTTIHEDQSDVEVVAFDVELNDDGCLGMDRFDLYVGQDNAVTASNKPWDYFTDAHLLVNGDELASMSVDSSSDWSEYDAGTLGTTSQEYRLRFTGLEGLLASDETATVSVAFDTANTIDSGDEDAVWQFGTTTDSFRFTDGTGFTFTDGEDLASSFAFEGADEAALVLSAATEDPDAQVIEVSDSNDTNGETIGMFDIEETQDVNVNISEMTVSLTTSDTITDEIRTLYLYNGSTKVGQENVTASPITFDNIDLDVDAGDTVTLTVKADLKDTNDQARYVDGATIRVSAVNLTAYTDEFDNDEGDFTETGSYAGNTHALYANGMRAEFVSGDAEKTFVADAATEDDQGTYTIVFDVTAFGEDIYLDADTEADGASTASGSYTMADAACVSTETFTATINGTAVVYTATVPNCSGADSADTLAIMTGLAAAIDADGTVGPLVNASVSDGVGTTTINIVAVTAGAAGNYTTTASDTSAAETLVASQVAMTGGVNDNVPGQGVEFSVNSTAGTPTVSSKLLEAAGTESGDVAGASFMVPEGETRRFTLTVILTADTTPTDGSHQLLLKTINWDNQPNGTDATPDFYYDFDMGDYKTPYLFLNGIA